MVTTALSLIQPDVLLLPASTLFIVLEALLFIRILYDVESRERPVHYCHEDYGSKPEPEPNRSSSERNIHGLLLHERQRDWWTKKKGSLGGGRQKLQGSLDNEILFHTQSKATR